MNLYRRVWRVVWLAIGSVPVGLGLLQAPPVALFCLGSIVAAVVAAMGQPARTWSAAGLLGAAVMAGLWSFGGAGVGLLALAGVTSPPVVSRAYRYTRHHRHLHTRTDLRSEVREVDVAPVLSADLLAGPVRALDDEQLFLSWSESFVVLKLTRTIDERRELVNLRQAYLDELESRNPTGFSSWLRCSASPIGNPQSHFQAPEAHLDAPSTASDD